MFIIKQLKVLFMAFAVNNFAVDASGYPDSPGSTNVPARANATQAAAQTSFEEYNNSELEVISIAKGRTPFMHTLINLGR